MSDIDLHCHSTVSDGLLTPAELVRHAVSREVKVLALTDHDDVGGLSEAGRAAAEHGIAFVNGVEISVTWRSQTVHVVGLGIDPADSRLAHGLALLRDGRAERAGRIAAQLEKAGIKGSLEGAYAHARNERLIGRTHFARFLVERGYVKDVKTVFKKYLVKGRPGYVPHQWAGLDEAIGWIRASGGTAVLAHPGRYKLSKSALGDLLTDFRMLGGGAIEVVTGNHTVEQAMLFAFEAKRFDLLASAGSDYHGPGESHFDLGRLPQLPNVCRPVWEDSPVLGAIC